jgi:hypothetical protein
MKMNQMSCLVAAIGFSAFAIGCGDDGGGGGTGGSSGAGGSGAVSGESLPLDATGWVARDSNDFGIQGAVYWYSDNDTGGQTQLTGLTAGAPPFDTARSAMCLVGTTPGGQADNFVTWGSGIGINLNQEDGNDATPPLATPPRCFAVTLAVGSAPGELLGKLLPQNPMPGNQEAPSVALKDGTTDVCTDNAAPPSWCSTQPGKCWETGLATGVASLQIQVNSGSTGGPFDVCVTSVVPHS